MTKISRTTAFLTFAMTSAFASNMIQCERHVRNSCRAECSNEVDTTNEDNFDGEFYLCDDHIDEPNYVYVPPDEHRCEVEKLDVGQPVCPYWQPYTETSRYAFASGDFYLCNKHAGGRISTLQSRFKPGKSRTTSIKLDTFVLKLPKRSPTVKDQTPDHFESDSEPQLGLPDNLMSSLNGNDAVMEESVPVDGVLIRKDDEIIDDSGVRWKVFNTFTAKSGSGNSHKVSLQEVGGNGMKTISRGDTKQWEQYSYPDVVYARRRLAQRPSSYRYRYSSRRFSRESRRRAGAI